MNQTYTQLRLDLGAALASFLSPREASLEAVRWFEEGLGKDRVWMAAHGDEGVPDEVRRQVSRWVRQRQQGMPWAYILGWTSFRGRRFKVSPDTLIPRPETELVLEAALEVGRRLKVRRACDIGTGTGILAISLALETDWEITASDLSPAALAIAKGNATALGAAVTFFQGDLLGPVPAPLGLVVSNPPYVDPADEPGLQRELGFEPRMALFAEDHGLALSEAILRQAKARMAPAVVLEIGAEQGRELVARAENMGWARVTCSQDFAGHDRVLVALG